MQSLKPPVSSVIEASTRPMSLNSTRPLAIREVHCSLTVSAALKRSEGSASAQICAETPGEPSGLARRRAWPRRIAARQYQPAGIVSRRITRLSSRVSGLPGAAASLASKAPASWALAFSSS